MSGSSRHQSKKRLSNNEPSGIFYIFSLRIPYVWTTSAIVALLFLLYLFLDLFLGSPDWAPLIPALFLYVHVWTVWVFFLRRLFGKPTGVDEIVLFMDLILIYVFSLLQNTGVYASIARLDQDAFAGIPSDSSPIARIGLSLFLAIETIAALGTGAIFANNESPWGFIFIAIQSVQSMMFIGIIIAKVMTLVQMAHKRIKKGKLPV